MKYYLDNQLICVGVVDILPQGMSQVFFFYDPDLKKLSLGILGNIQEIFYVKQINSNQFKYYYLGFYIKNILKMAYKGNYEPAELLCPLTYNWMYFQEALKIISLKVPLYMQSDMIQDMKFDDISLKQFVEQNLRIVISNKNYNISQINPFYQKHLFEILKNVVLLLGKKLSNRFSFGY